MRGYECVFSYMGNDDKLVEKKRYACWGQVMRIIKDQETDTINIYDFRDKETEEYISFLIKTINKITPCELIITDNKEETIEIKLLKTYDQSLIILNFIRLLWHVPESFDSKAFFKHLVKSTYIDPLKRLTASNIKGCTNIGNYSPGHSNCHNASKLKIKDKEELKNYTYSETITFLTR